MRPEVVFWNWMKPKLVGHAMRVENILERGTPDVNWAANGKEIWMELKVDDGKGTLLRKEQWVWMVLRMRQGIDVLIVSKRPSDKTVRLWHSSNILQQDLQDVSGKWRILSQPAWELPMSEAAEMLNREMENE